MQEFKDKVAVITGATSGIGRALAERCAHEGMRVVLADVNVGALTATEAALKATGAPILAVVTDVSKAQDVDALAQQTLATFGAVHLLCNNAGVWGGISAWDSSLADWEWVLGVNLWGVIHGLHTFVPLMLAQGTPGHIVNTASMAGLQSGLGFSPYAASKFAVVAMSEGLANELAPRGIGITVLCPGFVRTRIWESGRNRPARYGPARRPDPASTAGKLLAHLAERGRTGLDPDDVAAQAVAAIRANELYVFTHPEMRDEVDARFAAITAALDKASAR